LQQSLNRRTEINPLILRGKFNPFTDARIRGSLHAQATSRLRKRFFMEDVVIVSAARTPVGSFNGAFANVPAHELGRIAIKAALERAHVDGKDVSETIMGQILTAAQGQNPARQASMNAGIPAETPAWIVNQLCGSGLRAVALGYQAILNGDATSIVAGGQGGMRQTPHA